MTSGNSKNPLILQGVEGRNDRRSKNRTDRRGLVSGSNFSKMWPLPIVKDLFYDGQTIALELSCTQQGQKAEVCNNYGLIHNINWNINIVWADLLGANFDRDK